MIDLSYVRFLTGTEFSTEEGSQCRAGLVSGKWGSRSCRREQREGAKEQSVGGVEEEHLHFLRCWNCFPCAHST